VTREAFDLLAINLAPYRLRPRNREKRSPTQLPMVVRSTRILNTEGRAMAFGRRLCKLPFNLGSGPSIRLRYTQCFNCCGRL
jgi:hypothetical protein